MFFIAFAFLIGAFIFSITDCYEVNIDFKDYNVPYIFGTLIIFLLILLSGLTLSWDIMPQEIDDFNASDKTEVYEIKDFEYKEISQGGYKDNEKVYSYKLNDSVKKEVKADSDTMVVLNKSSDEEKYTKVTIKEKECFNWMFFTTDTYKQYVFS